MNEKFYNLSKEDATQIISDAQIYGVFPQYFIVIFLGYIYEIFGRKYVIFILILLCTVFTYLLPVTSPNKDLFVLISICGSVSVVPILNSPLLQDYVEVESRGKAGGITVMGMAFGIIGSLAIIVQFTKKLDPLISFGVIAGTNLFFAIVSLFIIKEP
jgi:MFS family permease